LKTKNDKLLFQSNEIFQLAMTLYEFKMLDEMEQTETLWEKGVHIGEHAEDDHNIVLSNEVAHLFV
jgi:hypothetical protein